MFLINYSRINLLASLGLHWAKSLGATGFEMQNSQKVTVLPEEKWSHERMNIFILIQSAVSLLYHGN